MGTADGIEHIVGLIMCGGVKPEFAHGNVCIAIVTHSVAHHRGGYTFCRELNTILMGTIANSLEEHFILKFIDGLTDISENLLTLGSTLYGNTHHDGQPRNEVVATSFLKLFSKILAPILRTTLPGVDMHILHHIGKWAFFEFTKPAGNLFSDSSFRELVAFQTFAASCCSISMTCRSVTNTNNKPVAIWQWFCQSSVFYLYAKNIL